MLKPLCIWTFLGLFAAIHVITAADAPEGFRVFVSHEGSGDLTVIDSRDWKVVNTIPAGERPRGIPVGTEPQSASVSPDGKRMFAISATTSEIQVIDTATDSVIANIQTPEHPRAIAISPDGAFLITANGPSNDVSVIDAATFRVIHRVACGSSPCGLAIAPD